MHKTFRSLFAVTLFCLCASIALAAEIQIKPGETMGTLKLGSMEVLAVQDTPGEMDIALFHGPLSEKERASYFTNGKTPAGVNVFVIRAGGKVVLVDTGFGATGEAKGHMLEHLAAVGIKPENVDIVLLTHMHFDHILGLLKKDGDAVAPTFPKATVLVSAPEAGFWLGKEVMNSDYAAWAKSPQAVAKAYGDRLKTFNFNDTVFPGVTAVEAVGHTPGHTAFLLEDKGKRLLIAGDIVHAAALQFPHPEECPEYDMDAKQAVVTRKAILSRAAKEKLLIAGMHIPFSGIGYVTENGKGGFVFTHLEAKD